MSECSLFLLEWTAFLSRLLERRQRVAKRSGKNLCFSKNGDYSGRELARQPQGRNLELFTSDIENYILSSRKYWDSDEKRASEDQPHPDGVMWDWNYFALQYVEP